MNVTVEGFSDVAAYQFSMTWDPAVLQFQSIGYNLAGLSASHFNTTQTSGGQLSTAFVPSSAISLPDGASLFSLQFLAVGAAGASTDIAFGNVPTAIAFYNSAIQKLGVLTENATILTQEPVLKAFPFPMYEEGAIYFKIQNAIALNVTYVPGNPAVSTPELYPIFQKYGVIQVERPFAIIDKPVFLRIYRVYFSKNSAVQAFLKDLAAVPFVEFTEKVPYKMPFKAPPPPITPNDPSITGPPTMNSYQLGLMKAYEAFGVHTGGGAVVAIVDDAVLTTHEDLYANIYSLGWDAADGDANADPPLSGAYAAEEHLFSHGTHVAGIAGAVTDNHLGIASIGWANTIMPIKSVKDNASPSVLTHCYDGVAWATVNGAQVINMSWGGAPPSQAEYLVIENAYNSGIILVAAAGNWYSTNPFYPAAYGEGKTGQSWEVLNRKMVIAVSALDQNNNQSIWAATFYGYSASNFGDWVDVSAYGTDIYSSVAGSSSGNPINNLYTNYNGTSMAAPQVAGLAGLMRSYKPAATVDEIVDCILHTANPDIYDASLHPDNIPGTLGSGRINAYDAIRCLGVSCPGTDALAYIVPNAPVLCPGGSTQLTANTGVSYSWSNSSTAQSIHVSTTGIYTVTITFSGGCTATKSVPVVAAPTTPVIRVMEGSGLTGGDGLLCGMDFLFLTAFSGSSYQWSAFGATTPSIGPINAGVYTPFTWNYSVTVTDVGGCPGIVGVASGVATWLDPPEVSISIQENSQLSNDGIICAGASASILASGGNYYHWSNGEAVAAIMVNPSTTTTYTVTVTDVNGCTNTASAVIQVRPNCLSTCCSNAAAFRQKVAAGFTRSSGGCTLVLTSNQLDDCQQITYNWGDGSTTGPVAGNAPVSHTYSATHDYSVCVQIKEYNEIGQACYQKDSCFTVCVVCDCTEKQLALEWGEQTAPANPLLLYRQDVALNATETALFSASSATSTNYKGLIINNFGKQDAVLSKINPANGSVIKALALGSIEDDNAGAIAVSGNYVYVAGVFYGPTCTIPSGTSAPDLILANSNPSLLQSDLFLAKYNTNLELIWAFSLGAESRDALTDIAIDQNGDIVVTGNFRGTVDFAPQSFITANRSTNGAGMFVAKYSPAMSLIWAFSYEGSNDQISVDGWGITSDASNSVLVVGEVYGGPSGGSASIGSQTFSVAPNTSTNFLVKFDGIYGSSIWEREILPSQGAAFSVKTDGNQILVGGGGFIASYTNAGSQNWVYPTDFFIYDIETDAQKRFYLTGYSDKSAINFDFKNAAQPKASKGREDIVAAVYAPNANFIKGYNPGGSNYDDGYGLAAARDGSAFFIQGLVWSADFSADPLGNNPIPAINNLSHFIGKFTCDCPGDVIPDCNTCCQNQQAFFDKAGQGFFSTHQKCGISVTPKALDDCQRVTYTWGDGSTTGPLTSNTTTGHIYPEPGYYTICAKIEELNSTGTVCFSSDTCWSICAVCDTCKNPLVKSEWAKAPYEWQNYNGGTTQFDMYADAQGDFYVTGNHTVPTKGEDGFVAKYKSDGTLAWDFSFGGTDSDKGNLINNNPLDGGFYLAGKFRSTSFDLPSFGSSSPVSLSLTGTAPRSDVFLARYDANRNLIWAFTLGGVWDDQMDGMAVDGSGNVYVAGTMRAEVNFNPLGPSQILTLPVYAPFVAKYHPDGQLEWVRFLYDPTKVQCGANLGLALDADANVYVGGEFYGTPHWEGWPSPSPFPALAITTNVPSTSNSTGVPYVAKLKSNGDFVWAFDLQDLAKDKSGAIQDVEVKDNYLYITGGAVANANINFAPLGGAPILQAPRPSGNFIARYNLQGQAQKGFALPLLYAVDELEISVNDQVYAAGYIDGTNSPRMLVNIFDADLNLTKSLQTGSGGAPIDIASSVAPDLFGSFGVAGSFKSQQFDADPQAGNGFEFPAFTNGLSHVFIGKYACDCPGEPINPCGPCDSIAATLVHKPSQQGCCAAIKIQNQLPNYFSAIQFNVLSGGSLLVSDVTPSAGWQISGFVSGVSVAVKPAGGGSIPVGNNPCAFVCMSKLSANDQYIEVEYLSANGETVCRDTLHFVCNYCAQIRVDSISCEDGGRRKVTFCVNIDPDLGWNASSIVLMPMPGVTFSPASFPLPSVPPGGLHCSLTTFVSFAPGARTDSLCIPFTLHEADVTQGLPPLLCCMGKQCIVLPDCLCDPDITYATQQKGDFGEGQCCWDITLHQMAGMIFGVQTNILTPGVSFQAVAPGSSWDFMLRSPQSLVWTPDMGGTLPATLPLPTLCLDVPKGSPSPQVLEIVWLSTDSSICRQRLEFNCTSLDTNCAALTPKSLGCSQPLPGHNIYTVTVTNPFNSTLSIVPNHIAVVAVTPSGALLGNGIFPVGDLLPGHSTDIQIPLQGATGTKVCFKLNLYRKTNPNLYEECCVTPDTFCVVLKNCGQANSPLSIAFYPNPTKGHVTLDFGAAGSPANGLVRIRDLAGRLLREEAVPPGSWTHDLLLPDLASGLYLTEFVENNTRLWVGKMSVLR